MRALLQRAWLRRGWLAWLLWPVSLLYGMLVAIRHGLYRSGRLETGRAGVPVLVVGNVVAGGSGKTPVVIALVRHLRERGLHPGVVSRGHGRRGDACAEVFPDSRADEAGDEPALIARACGVPVFVARKRMEAVTALRARHPQVDVIVSDDGLQHHALGRDIEICVFDDRGAGNGFLLPAGPLREPWPRAVDFVLHTGMRPAFAGFTARRELAGDAVRADGSRVALASLAGKPLVALAGIAHPEAFFAMLRERGLTLARTIALPDHHDFSAWQPLAGAAQGLLCTEKDAVKLWRIDPHALAVPLAVTLDPAFLAQLDRRLDAKLSSGDGHQTS